MAEEVKCPCSLVDLPLGDPQREAIMDCQVVEGTTIRPCLKLIPPQTAQEKDAKPKGEIQPGSERHTKQATKAYFGLSHPIKRS